MGENQIVSEQKCAKRNAGVGHVECGPVILSGVHVNEIDHKSEPYAVRQISQDAGEQKRARAENSIIVALRAKEINQDGNGRGTGEHYEEPAPERATLLQLSEGNTGILSVREIEEAADHGSVAKSQAPKHPGLARLIRQIDAQRGG